MDTTVPGGQQVYVDASGVLMYTKPHSTPPKGAITKGFVITSGIPGTMVGAPEGWFKLCPEKCKGKGPYKVFVATWKKPLQDKNVPSRNAKHCFDILMNLDETISKFGGSAYMYA
ncbi:hypothetical protein H072_4589 [Dactylellina haptotyla CBS 200.50]|uniref:Uncharacterized protein n=1 Tax=Dactylellina haptotyla (strain CBS 200.50) TaxID=1284197 RepID=S8AEN8_DACHA|nr:hypothetical protein H072_4589 [Dactylellina haptotyla CBS 200.50]